MADPAPPADEGLEVNEPTAEPTPPAEAETSADDTPAVAATDGADIGDEVADLMVEEFEKLVAPIALPTVRRGKRTIDRPLPSFASVLDTGDDYSRLEVEEKVTKKLSAAERWKEAASKSKELYTALAKPGEERTEEDCRFIYNVLVDQRVLTAKSDSVKRQLCRKVGYESHEPGSSIIREGDVGDVFYMILTGIVDIFVAAVGRDAVTHMSPGQDFGEQALQQKDARRNATCVARTPVELITLNRENYQAIMMLDQEHKGFFAHWGYRNLDTEYSYLEVDVSAFGFGEPGGLALAEALKTNPRVATLMAGGNNIGPVAGHRLGLSVGASRTIETLDISGNDLGDEGAVALGRGLAVAKKILRLNIRNNGIADEGALSIAKGIRENSTLISVDMSLNNVGDDGATALAAGLLWNTSIIKLDLRRNDYGDEGKAALAEAQTYNTLVYINGERYKAPYRPYM